MDKGWRKEERQRRITEKLVPVGKPTGIGEFHATALIKSGGGESIVLKTLELGRERPRTAVQGNLDRWISDAPKRG